MTINGAASLLPSHNNTPREEIAQANELDGRGRELDNDVRATQTFEDVPLVNEQVTGMVVKPQDDGQRPVVSSTTWSSNDASPITVDGNGHPMNGHSGEHANKKADDDDGTVVVRNWCGQRQKATVQNGADMGVHKQSLEDQANCVSTWLLTYLTPLLQLGAHKVLEFDDIGVPSAEDLADRAHEIVAVQWEHQRQRARTYNADREAQYQEQLAACDSDAARKLVPQPKLQEPSMFRALVKGFGVWRFVWSIWLYVITAFLQFVPVLILNKLVIFFESGQSINDYQGIQQPWLLVAGLAVVPVAVSLLQTRSQAIMAHCAVFVRTAVSTLLYRKALRVSAPGRAKTSTGQVVNMMSNDTAQLQRFLQFIGMILVAPLQLVVALVLIYGQVGNATWVGVGFMVALAPVNVIIFSIISKQRRKVLKYSDLRVKMMNEILAGIRIIKFYAWERPFGKEVGQLRGKELQALTRLAYTSAIGFSLILLSAPLIQPILVFMTYVAIQDEPLRASTAFTTVALFNIMRFPFAFLPMGLLQYIQSRIALRRLERYLDLPELDEYVESTKPPNTSTDDLTFKEGSITFRDCSFSWSDPQGRFIKPVNFEEEKKKKKKKDRRKSARTTASLSDADMRESAHSARSSVSSAPSETPGKPGPTTLFNLDCVIEAGSLVAVVGPVGAGKSSFLSAVLGEMEPVNNSKIYLPRPQDAPTGYVSYCAQTPWVVNDTVRGNVVFGREFDQDRYDAVIEASALLDDLAILPAGDFTEIGERGINLSGGQKARVSLARALYSDITKVILMDDPLSAVDSHVGEHIFSHAIAGPIAKGITRVLVTHHVHLLPRCDKVIVMERGRIAHMGTYRELVDQGVNFAGAVDVSKVKRSTKKTDNEMSENGEMRATVEKDAESTAEKKAELAKSGKKLVNDEEREEGQVAGSAYVHYARAGGWWMAVLVCVIQGIGRGSEVMAGFWLAIWADKSYAAAESGDPQSKGETNFYLGIYALFGMIGVVGLTLRSIIIAVHRLGASKKLHDDLTESVLRAPVAFFDVTPTGRILNRFAADMDKVDLELTQSLSQGVTTVFQVIGALGAIVASTKGTLVVPLVPIGYMYYLIQGWFRHTSVEVQRLTSIANSPIFADFSQTLSGVSTIRAYGEERRFFEHCKMTFDKMNACFQLTQLTNFWLGLRLDVLGGLISAFIGGVAVATSGSGFIPAGWLGLSLSYSIEITNYLKFGVRMIATIEAQMNSVERILFYTEKIEPERPEFIPEKDPDPGAWPEKGEIQINHASMRYRDGPLVLKDISLKVNAGERVGVCGRTGSGKSSLMVLLFRIAEIEADGGKVMIDNVNTADIGVAALRLNLAIIPQDPIIFSNTVRYNLDPFNNSSDEEIWETLKKVQMEEVVAALPEGLDESVAENGDNFSQGQRQLLCIARSLLRRPKILVLDEATASIDNNTDAKLQEMIRENFKKTTVLTIAHRLNTIMDSDRVLVLENGRIVEFDTPETLLGKEDGVFKAMVNKSDATKSTPST